MLALIIGYVAFATGLMALLVALMPDQRKADALRNIVGMGLGIAGGCAFPPEQFPPFLREHIMPFLPTHWFVSAARSVEFGGPQRGEKADRGIRIPGDFTARMSAKEATNLEFYTVAGSNAADAALIEARLVRALVTVNSQPLVSLDAKFAGRKPVPTGFNFSLPGNLVNFLMMNLLIFGGSTVAASRRSGVLRRILTLPVRRGELVAGLIYGLVLPGSVQIAFFLLVGRFVFDVNPGSNVPGVAIVLLVFAWLAAMGVLVGSRLDAHDRVIGICVLASLIMAAVGGCWWPLEIAPAAMKTASRFVPSGWALEALHQLISFGSALDAVITPLLVLAGFGTAATFAAARFFRV